MQLARASARVAAAAALDRRHAVQDRLDEEAVVPVGAGDQHVQRESVGIDEQVVLAAGLAAVGGVRAGQRTPLICGGTPGQSGSVLRVFSVGLKRCRSAAAVKVERPVDERP